MKLKVNSIYCKDKYGSWLEKFPESSIDLIYDDFWRGRSMQRDYHELAEGVRYYMEEYYRILKNGGSIYVRCDCSVDTSVSMALDDIFGPENFVNEIIWHYMSLNKLMGITGKFAESHDIIFFYTKESHGYPITFNIGERKIMDDVLEALPFSPKEGDFTCPPPKAKENLLEQIIETSSNPNDVVLDPWCRDELCVYVANKLKRKWVGIVSSVRECNSIVEKLQNRGVTIEEEDIHGVIRTEEEARRLDPFDFQKWICRRLGGKVSDKKTRDGEIDGWKGNTAIQVKEQDEIGGTEVKEFEEALDKKKIYRGTMVAFSFGEGAREEARDAKYKKGFKVELKTVREILKEK